MQLMSQSRLSVFRNCQRKAYWQYERNLETLDRPDALTFGTLVHDALEQWHGGKLSRDGILDEIARKGRDGECRIDHAERCGAMIAGYTKTYPTEAFDVVALEQEFEMPVRNPATGHASRTWRMHGRVDGVVRMNGKLWLLEHKTASKVDAGYIDKLWIDPQIALYSLAMHRAYGEPVVGILYNVLLKPKIRQKQTESEAEFYGRLREWHENPDNYQRIEIHLTPYQMEMAVDHLWQLGKQYRQCQLTGDWATNPSNCFAYYSKCPFFDLCRSGGNQIMIDNCYQQREKR